MTPNFGGSGRTRVRFVMITPLPAGNSGDLIIKNAGMFQQGGDGNIVDDQLIVAATGGLAGATGVLRASGTFTNGAGASEYEGRVCLPRT